MFRIIGLILTLPIYVLWGIKEKLASRGKKRSDDEGQG
jgi:hypothetical protein